MLVFVLFLLLRPIFKKGEGKGDSYTQYLSQTEAWSPVHLGKVSSWLLLVQTTKKSVEFYIFSEIGKYNNRKMQDVKT